MDWGRIACSNAANLFTPRIVVMVWFEDANHDALMSHSNLSDLFIT